jgi:hypothetical protein
MPYFQIIGVIRGIRGFLGVLKRAMPATRTLQPATCTPYPAPPPPNPKPETSSTRLVQPSPTMSPLKKIKKIPSSFRISPPRPSIKGDLRPLKALAPFKPQYV